MKQSKREKALESALKVIRTWADYDLSNHTWNKALHPKHVVDLCDKVLKDTKLVVHG